MTQPPPGPPLGLRVRPARSADLNAVVDLLNTCSRETTGRDGEREAGMRCRWGLPGFRLETDSLLAETAAGEVVGYAHVVVSAPHVQGTILGRVHPSFRGLGLGSHLLDFAMRRGEEQTAAAAHGLRTTLMCDTARGDEPSAELLREHGFGVVRHFLELAVELDREPAPRVWPAGLELRSFDLPTQGRAVCAAFVESFSDHWGHVDKPFEAEYERFSVWMADEELDFDLWWVAWDGDEIAGVCLCWPHADSDPGMGWVGVLGVRRPWRGMGLGLSLLLESFAGFSARGVRRVGLAVDAENLTGALRLYRRAGMDVEQAFEVWERELRAGEDLTRYALDQ